MGTVTYLAHAGAIGWDESLMFALLPIPVIAYLVLTARPPTMSPADADDESDAPLDGWSAEPAEHAERAEHAEHAERAEHAEADR